MKHLALFALFSLSMGNAEASSSLVGSWYDGSKNLVTILDNGEYFMLHDARGANDPLNLSGLEYGAYSWNSSTGAFSGTDLVNTTGDWQAVPAITSLSVTGNTLSVNNGAHTLTSVPNVNNSILGSWYVQGAGPGQGEGVATFLAGGEFFFAEVKNNSLDPSGQNGMERGAYTWDGATGAFTGTVLLDTNGAWGFSNISVNSINVAGDQFTLSFADAGNPGGVVINAARGVSAIPLPAAGWLFMSGLMGLFFRVRQKAGEVCHWRGALA